MATLENTLHTRPRIGYALGGGAVRGAAHLGFLSVFEEAGIRPDLIAGTSAGAIVGAGYAAGVSVQDMSRMIASARWREVTSIAWRSRTGLFDITPLAHWLEGAIGDITFAELNIPLGIVACNIVDGHKVVLTEGPVKQAAVASSAIPGLFNPVSLDGTLLIDGGMIENLPVRTAREMGADIVIAVDVSPVLRHTVRPNNLRDVITTTITIVAANNQVQARAEADFLVQPKIERFAQWDLGSAPEIQSEGRAAALELVDDVLALIETYTSHAP